MNEISQRIRYVGVNDGNKTLFEGLWPLPYGVSYNAYLVVDEKVALIDTVEYDFIDQTLKKIEEEIGGREVDYLIVNHMEPDHSSGIAAIKEAYPDIKIVTNAKAVPMIAGYYGIADNIMLIKDGETLSLGNTTLSFYMTPMVHWPETMMTYCVEEKTLFSADAFGTFGAIDVDVRDSHGARMAGLLGEPADTLTEFKGEMCRYYSNIVGKYGMPVQNALKKLSGLEIGRICSTHGPVWEKQIPQVVGVYDKLSKYEGERGVCLVYASMYGNTAAAAKAIEADLIKRGVPYGIHDLCVENVSFAYRDAFRYDTIAVGSPTYNNEIFPPVRAFMGGLEMRGLKNRRFMAFGSYTWMGGSVKLLNEIAAKLGFELVCDGVPFAQGFSPDKVTFPEL